MNSNKRQPTRVTKACDRCRRQKQRCDFFRPCSICNRMGVECTQNGSDPKSRAKSEFSSTPCRKNDSHQAAANATIRRRKSSQAATDIIASSIGDERITVADIVPDPRTSLCFPDLRDKNHQDPHSNENTIANAPQLDYPKELSVGSGSWHALDKTGGLTGGPDTSPPPRPALIDFAYADSAVDISNKILQLRNSHPSPRATYAIPGGEAPSQQSPPLNPACLVPVRELIGFDLPDAQTCHALVKTYFLTVHWFSLVIYEPRFRPRYQQIVTTGYANRSEYGFLLLLLMILSLGCKYGPIPGQNLSSTSDGSAELSRMHDLFLKKVREQFMDIMDEESLEYVQLCTLLGSFYLYHGRPRSSFSILGAATKTAQAMGLHRDSGLNFPEDVTEERKRVWWTIYTWDRLATILHGRPLSISDKDCNVPMPRDIRENVHFDRAAGSEVVGLSLYQERLNQVYQIASPIIETIYGNRMSNDVYLPEMVALASGRMREWQDNLPIHLALDKASDITPASSTAEKMIKLQALSLALTYDSLMIIIHRHLLAEQRPNLDRFRDRAPSQAVGSDVSPELNLHNSTLNSNFRNCLNSVLSVPRIENKPELLKLAAETHLAAFLGTNLFSSAVVMSVCALSDPLSDVAQEAKRGITRALLVVKSLGRRDSLSNQGSVILEDIVQLILEKEKDEMLRSAQAGVQNTQMNMLHLQNGSIHDSPSVTYDSDNGTTSDSYTPPLGATAILGGDSGDQGLHHSLISLPKGFPGNACSRSRPGELYYRCAAIPADLCDVSSNISGDGIRSHDSDPSWMEELSGQGWFLNADGTA